MPIRRKKITVIIPCHNEEEGIRHVLEEFPYQDLRKHGYNVHILVIDNNSTDRTSEVARSLGAEVIFEAARGKGNAVRTGFWNVPHDSSYVIMLDGDNTYKAKEILRLIEPLESNFCDVIVGSRLGGKTHKGALRFQNRFVNWCFAFMVRHFLKANVTDVLSGFFAWKKEVVDELNKHLVSKGFSIEMEMIIKMVKLGFEMYSVPITYDVRDGETKISAVKDGVLILGTFMRYVFWKSPSVKTVTYKA